MPRRTGNNPGGRSKNKPAAEIPADYEALKGSQRRAPDNAKLQLPADPTRVGLRQWAAS